MSDFLHLPTYPEDEKRSRFSVIRETAAFMMEHPENDLKISALALRTGMSETVFRHQFKAVMGSAPLEYLLRARLRRAVFLMGNSPMSAAEAGALSGFPDPNYFSRVFRKHLKLSPLEFRKKVISGEPLPEEIHALMQ